MIMQHNLHFEKSSIKRADRERINGHRGALVWFTGLSGAGKSTLADNVAIQLHAQGVQTFVLDGDNLRHGLCSDLGFSERDRAENIRRVGEVAKLFVDAGFVTLAAFISPSQSSRAGVRSLFNQSEFFETYCRCPLDVCEQRDVKGLYQRARTGEIPLFTGITSPYEVPATPELIIDTGRLSIDASVREVLRFLVERDIIASDAPDRLRNEEGLLVQDNN